MESLILEGCELMDDNLFVYLLSSLIRKDNSFIMPIEDKHICLKENLCCQTTKSNHFLLCYQCSHLSSNKFKLKILNLSGCYRFTDFTLK